MVSVNTLKTRHWTVLLSVTLAPQACLHTSFIAKGKLYHGIICVGIKIESESGKRKKKLREGED